MWFRHPKEPSAAFSKATIVLGAFFLLLFAALFLGDGKQPMVDTFFAGGIVSLWVIAFYQKQKIRPLPPTIQFLWMAVFAAYAVSTVFSDSIGYSISSVVRLCIGFLVYHLFYSLSSPKLLRLFAVGTTVFVGLAAVAAAVYTLFPSLDGGLPLMNLLYASYGHNQLAGLLLFGIPVVVAKDAPIPSWCKKVLFVLFLSGMVFSFARGAWILLAAYFMFLLVTKRLEGKFNISMAIVFVGAVAGLLLTMFLLAPRLVHEPHIANNGWLYKQTIKPSAYESRVQYWLQALRAIQERPIVGSGPGTFYLQSKKFQSAPLSYSWFAHSFVLEQFVEVGMVGLILWVMLFVVQWRLLTPLRTHPIFIGAMLTFLYSLYEYNLNFLVIWLLFWSALGWLTGSTQLKKTSSSRPSFLVMGGAVLLFVFSLFSIGGTIETVANKSDAASLFTPFVADTAITSIEDYSNTVTPMPQKHLSLLLFFHRKNPEILYAVATYYVAMGQQDAATQWFEAAIRQDPKNFIYQQEYLRFIIENGLFSLAGPATKQFSLNVLPNRLYNEIKSVPFTSSDLAEAWPSIDINKLESNPPDLYFAKLYYVLGKNMLSDNVAFTKQLWTLAKDIYPDMGLLYHELASLEFYSFHDMNEAQKIIAECMRIPHAALHCKQIAPDLSNVGRPGSVEVAVLQYQQ